MDKLDLATWLMIFAALLLTLGLISVGIYYETIGDYNYHVGSCYDGYGNEIDGLSCNVREQPEEMISGIIGAVGILTFSAMLITLWWFLESK